MSTVKKVQEFHELFQHPVLKTPQIPAKERCKLRIALIEEELKELKEAIENNDIVEAADAFTDLQYVLDGAMLEFGLGDIKEDLFNEVHRSNMSKACATEEEAKATVLYHTQKGDDGFYKFDETHKVYFVYRNSDQKLLKSVNYSPANLKSIVENV